MEPLEIGVFAIHKGSPEATVEWVNSIGVKSIQLLCPPEECWADPQAFIQPFNEAGIKINVMFYHFPGESYADVPTIRETVGLVQDERRAERLGRTEKMSDFAAAIGVGICAAHIGFVPEDTQDEAYQAVVAAVQQICDYCAGNNQRFALETGQESAEALLQFIQDVDRPNLGVNFDPANMVLYGSGEPIVAMEVVKDYIISCHCKDGVWPEREGELGTETPLGQGQVGLPDYFAKLKEIGYTGPVTIEREIEGAEQIRDIIESIKWLNTLR